MSWSEGWDLTTELLKDPSSHVGAALGGLDYPWSREAAVLADLFDWQRLAHSDPKRRRSLRPYPRPVPVDKDTQRSARPVIAQEAVKAALAARGH